MADIKRLNYFTSQFLVEKDFKDEQAYHVGMRRRHSQLLHTWGIADGGLQVSKKGDKSVEIGSGMAIDNEGREIVLLGPEPEAFTASNAEVYVTIKYQEVEDPEDSQTIGGVAKFVRTTERPRVETKTTVPPNDGSVILLAKVKLDASGNIGSVDTSVRKLAGPVIDPGTDLALRSLRVAGDASIGGKVGIGTTNPQHQLDVASSNGIKLGLEGNGGGQLVLANNKPNDNTIFLAALNAKGDGPASALLLTGRSGANVPQLSLMADKTFINGNVGIGTATPAGRLHIGGARPDIFLVGNTIANQDGLRIHYNETGGLRTGVIDVKGLSLSLRGESGTSGDGATDRFFIDLTTGNVGIGITKPAEPLEVNGRIKSGPLTVGPWPASASYAFFGANTLNQAAGGNYALLQGTTDGPGRTFLNSPVDIRFRIGNADKMILANNGNVSMLLGSNPINFTSGWTSSPDAVTNVAEISNDVGGFKTLMIVGNRSGGLGRRVSVWDRFEVNGTFVNASSVEVKQDVHALLDDDYRDILDKIEKTPLYRYRFRASGIDQKQRVGVIAEEAPEDILDETGKCVSLLDYVGFLFAGLKAQAKVINRLVTMLDGPQQNVEL